MTKEPWKVDSKWNTCRACGFVYKRYEGHSCKYSFARGKLVQMELF